MSAVRESQVPLGAFFGEADLDADELVKKPNRCSYPPEANWSDVGSDVFELTVPPGERPLHASNLPSNIEEALLLLLEEIPSPPDPELPDYAPRRKR